MTADAPENADKFHLQDRILSDRLKKDREELKVKM